MPLYRGPTEPSSIFNGQIPTILDGIIKLLFSFIDSNFFTDDLDGWVYVRLLRDEELEREQYELRPQDYQIPAEHISNMNPGYNLNDVQARMNNPQARNQR